MANLEHVALLDESIDSWNVWRKNSESPKHIDLSNTDLNGRNLSSRNLSLANFTVADLVRANLSYADLTTASLRHANLSGADLTGADLTGASLTRAKLQGANLTRANLSRADLSFANLMAANLSGANLRYANVRNSKILNTVFADVNLSFTKGLDSVFYIGPSTIGIDTIFRSKGAIPEIFLRGAGVPDAFITYAKSLVGSAIEYYSCFISYSTSDQKFAERLKLDLQARGVRCWFASHDVQGGRKLDEQIDEAIRLHDKLLLILSPHSMASEWVQTEISKARKREVRDKARVLFPISLAPFQTIEAWEAFDADTGKDSAREIREYFIPDFSNWKDHDSYQKAFERLVKDLKAPSERSSETSSGA